jgi:hypothetical protein
MPKVMGAMVSGALEISSWRLRRALLAEMDRVPLEELSNEPTKKRDGTNGPSIRQQVVEHIETLRKAFGNPPPDPTEGGSGTPSGPPSGTPSDTPQQPPAEGGPKGSTHGRAATHVRAAPAPAPAPAPTPTPAPSVVEVGGETSGSGGPITTPPDGDAPIDLDGFSLNDGMRRWAKRDGYADRVDLDYETAQFVSHFRANGQRRNNWNDEWQKWIRRAHKWASENQQRRSADVIQLPTGQTLSGTDAKVAGWMAIAEQLRQEGDPA